VAKTNEHARGNDGRKLTIKYEKQFPEKEEKRRGFTNGGVIGIVSVVHHHLFPHTLFTLVSLHCSGSSLKP